MLRGLSVSGRVSVAVCVEYCSRGRICGFPSVRKVALGKKSEKDRGNLLLFGRIVWHSNTIAP